MSQLDTLITTKQYFPLTLEIVAALIAPYPGFENESIKEYYRVYNATVDLRLNSMLLFFCILARVHLLIRALLIHTEYEDVRS